MWRALLEEGIVINSSDCESDLASPGIAGALLDALPDPLPDPLLGELLVPAPPPLCSPGGRLGLPHLP
jgi:hypothetical protein